MRYSSLWRLFALACFGALAAGCAPQGNGGAPSITPISVPAISPLVGTWTGEAKLATGNDLTKIENALSGEKMTGASKLTLKADGTGYLKVAKDRERPIKWRQDGQKVILTRLSEDESSSDSSKEDDSSVATVSDSSRSMTIDMGKVKVKLTKTDSSP